MRVIISGVTRVFISGVIISMPMCKVVSEGIGVGVKRHEWY